MNLLDRYVLRNFLEPFLICFGGFIAIWLIIDFSDNSNDFIQAHASARQIAQFYATQLPATVLLSLPIGMLLAILFSLSAMSRRNEIISMLTAGRSVFRVILPLLLVGLLMSAICLWLNWEMAPHADGIRKIAMKQIKRGRKAGEAEPVSGHLFRDRQNDRTWYVRRFRPGANQLADVHITQQAPDGRITRKWYASTARYDPVATTWTLDRGMVVDFNDAGDIASTDYFPTESRVFKHWTETPWRVASSQLDAAGLSIPELRDYLAFNSDFPPVQLAPYRSNLADRWALPVSCFVVILFATPLGIVFNRRGVLAGVAGAIFIFFALLMSRYLFLALGKGARLPPEIAPWVPDIAAAIVGLVLLYLRSTNRDLASLWSRKKVAPIP
jgi:LPS export ABC transporter permease LptG